MEERARRERARESADGIVAYATGHRPDAGSRSRSPAAWVADLAPARRDRPPGHAATGSSTRASPRTAATSAYVARAHSMSHGRTRHGPARRRHDPRRARRTRRDLGPGGVHRGGGDGPDARLLVVARQHDHPRAAHRRVARRNAGTSAIRRTPGSEPQVLAYPAAGTPNAAVTLWLIGLDGLPDTRLLRRRVPDRGHLGPARAVDHDADPGPARPAGLDGRSDDADRPVWPGRAATAAWVDVRPGLPQHLSDGSPVWLVDSGGHPQPGHRRHGGHATVVPGPRGHERRWRPGALPGEHRPDGASGCIATTTPMARSSGSARRNRASGPAGRAAARWS